ncbi:MAG: FKBP-type peptidyl-prolyl cis-trans isomerase, partial [Planctomycetales bacterium]|nr:FKBP-type peptidyl-prolyl cis-trans isomerase [Planctomycetales bacterium]
IAQQLTPIVPLGTKKVNDNASYGIGYNVGMDLAGGGLAAEDIERADFLMGLMDALAGEKPAVQPQAIQAAMQALTQKIIARREKAGAENKAVADKFLAENKTKNGVTTLDSGLQYQVLKSGNGATPSAANTVSVHYEGKLLNGSVFDSSIGGSPAEFPVTRVIPGWTQALMRMKVGDKWKLFIPPDLAYGLEPPPGSSIGINELLLFEVELLEVK